MNQVNPKSVSGAVAAVEPYRVMVVDDSAVIRGIFRRTLEVDPQISVVASVNNGQFAVDTLARQSVDVIVLDIEMPVMDGLTALPLLLEIDPDVEVIMASTLTQRNADVSLKALSAGATDYIPKPTAKHEIHSAESFKRELVDKVKALGQSRRMRARANDLGEKANTSIAKAAAAPQAPASSEIELRQLSPFKPEILCIGSSTGGPKALIEVLTGLKGNFNLPIVITQHMPKTFTGILAEHIDRISDHECAEGINGEPIKAGRIYVAPGGQHMLIAGNRTEPTIRIDDGPAENFCKPAVDPMLRSVAKCYGNQILTVILTGMGKDGLDGGRSVVEAGGNIIAQDEETSIVWGMPGAVANCSICVVTLVILTSFQVF